MSDESKELPKSEYHPCKVCGHVPYLGEPDFIDYSPEQFVRVQCQGTARTITRNLKTDPEIRYSPENTNAPDVDTEFPCTNSFIGKDAHEAIKFWQDANDINPVAEGRMAIQIISKENKDVINKIAQESREMAQEKLEKDIASIRDVALDDPDSEEYAESEPDDFTALTLMVKSALAIKGYLNKDNVLTENAYMKPVDFFSERNEPLVRVKDVLKAIEAVRPKVKKVESASACVLQEWVQHLPMMQQTVLMTAVRGPDNRSKYASPKMLLRWYRRCILLSAMEKVAIRDPYNTTGGSFTGPSISVNDVEALDVNEAWAEGRSEWSKPMHKLVDEYLCEVESIPIHFHTHFTHGIEILGYKHPDETTRQFWNEVYCRLCNHLHMTPETEEHLDYRLGDSRDQWMHANDSATLR